MKHEKWTAIFSHKWNADHILFPDVRDGRFLERGAGTDVWGGANVHCNSPLQFKCRPGHTACVGASAMPSPARLAHPAWSSRRGVVSMTTRRRTGPGDE